MTATRIERDYDFASTAAVVDPYPDYAEWQAEPSIHWNRRWGGWVVTRHADVLAALRDSRLSGNTLTLAFERLSPEDREKWRPLFNGLSGWAVFMDPPEHTRLRRFITSAITPRVIDDMRPVVASTSRALLEAVDQSRSVELVSDFAYALPASVIAQLLGADRADLPIIQSWSRDVSAIILGQFANADRWRRAQDALLRFDHYIRDMIQARRASGTRDDLAGVLSNANEDGDRLTDDEIVGIVTMLMVAGHETTTMGMTNAVATLLRHPDQLERLRADLTLMPRAVEELLRFEPSIKGVVRKALEPTEIAGVTVAAGERVLLVVAAANRDPSMFPSPQTFDISRPPSRHLVFGQGIHFCAGAQLAKMEMAGALTEILRVWDHFELEDPGLKYSDEAFTRRLVSLPLRVRRRGDPSPRGTDGASQ